MVVYADSMKTTSDFARQMKALLPAGAAWQSLLDPASVFCAVLAGLSVEFARFDQWVDLLTRELDPATAIETLNDWEQLLGLPDGCLQATTIQERQLLAKTRYIATGGSSKAYFLELADSLGYSISIEEYRPFRLGRSGVGSPFNTGDKPFTWKVTSAGIPSYLFRLGRSTLGDPFMSPANTLIECLFNRLKPAHTRIEYVYGA